MVRETLVSASVLAGLVGLALLYNNPSTQNLENIERADRIARDVFDDVLGDDLDLFDDEAAGKEFLKDFELSNDDVMLFQSEDADGEAIPGARAGGAKKQINQVKNCMKSAVCTKKAQESVKRWGTNAINYISANAERLLKPINSGYADIEEGSEFENQFELCTPNDDALPCTADAGPLDVYNANYNADPKTQYSVNADTQSAIDNVIENSSALQDAFESMKVDSVRDPNNAFSARAMKMFLVIPNGVPVSMPEQYNFRFGNYWRWFKNFNKKYIGVATGKGNESANRINFHFWFLRQDKNLKMIMRSPAKSSARFPWKRFDSIMLPNQNTAAQPKLSSTFQTLFNTIDDKGFASEYPGGQDCFTLWFHQYLPADVIDLSDSLFQEEVISKLEKACQIIHVWVGANKLADDVNTVKAIQYIQGLLQPSQLAKTSADPVKRGYYFIDDLESLAGEQGKNLMDQIYNDIALERNRATCLTATGGEDLALVFESRADERYDEYYNDYGTDSTSTASDYIVETTANLETQYALEYEAETTAEAITTPEPTEEPLPEDFKCCGIGFAAQKYDANNQACCEDGSVAASEADCFLL